MPKWELPVSLPRFTDEEYDRKREAYIAKEGYYVSVPRLRDIIHLGRPNEPDKAEFKKWRTGELRKTDPLRHGEITRILDDKRRKRNSFLASPVPTWGKNVASALTFLDDVNDSLGTAGVLCRFAARLAPRVLSRFLLGPVGWLFLAAELAGLILQLMRLPFTCLPIKRTFHGVAEMNPFSKQAKTRRARKLRRILPGKGELIEMAQTTDNIWGIGLCLGPIIGFAYDALAGTYRAAAGQEVTWLRDPPDLKKHERNTIWAMRNAQIAAAIKELMTEDEHLAMMLALNGATQIIKPYIELWNPLDEVEGLQYAEIQAPIPRYPTTIFVLEEVGIGPGQAVGWPGLDKEYASIEELWDYNQAKAADAIMDFATRNRRSMLGSVGVQNAWEFGLNMQALIEGPGTVEYEYEPTYKGWGNYFSTGCEAIQCQGGYRYSCGRWQHTTHRFGTQMVRVSG